MEQHGTEKGARGANKSGPAVAMSLQSRAHRWREIASRQQEIAATLQQAVHQQRDLLSMLAELGEIAALEDRGRALVDVLIDASRQALYLEEMELEQTAEAVKAVDVVLTGELETTT